MKRWALIWLFALGVALMGCVKMERIDSSAEEMISYAVGAYTPSTKATLNSEGITQFKSKAWLCTTTGNSALYGDDGETISYDNPVWSPSRTYYWPKSPLSYVNFISWYDNGGNPTVTEDSLAWTNRTIDVADTLMFADVAWRYKSGQVPTLFHHALTQVKFQAKATTLSDGGNSYVITFNSVTLNNVHKKGTLSLSTADPGSCGTVAWTTQGWVLDPDEVPGAITHTESVSVTADGDQSPNVIMDFSSVLPQSTDNITVTLCYTIRTNRAGGHYISENLTTVISLGSYDDWTMNHRTTYTITINPVSNAIQFVPSTEDWKADTSNTLYVE